MLLQEGRRRALGILYQETEVQLAHSDKKTPKFDKAKFDNAIEWIHSARHYTADMLKEEPGIDLIKETANILVEAYDLGIASGVITDEMDAKLRESLFLFSACKTHSELAEVSAMLRNDDGKIKSFEHFARDVAAVHENYNVNYLNAEYKFAVASAQMSAKWSDIERDGDRYDLQYRTAADDKVRQAHQVLHGITLSANDPFWDKFLPPNDWGCRCDVVQVRKAKYERADPDEAMQSGNAATSRMSGKVDKGAIFRFNPGKSRQLFPPKHPYYKISQAEKEVVHEITNQYNG